MTPEYEFSYPKNQFGFNKQFWKPVTGPQTPTCGCPFSFFANVHYPLAWPPPPRGGAMQFCVTLCLGSCPPKNRKCNAVSKIFTASISFVRAGCHHGMVSSFGWFSWGFLWFSFGFSWIFQWFTCDFLIVFLKFSCSFHFPKHPINRASNHFHWGGRHPHTTPPLHPQSSIILVGNQDRGTRGPFSFYVNFDHLFWLWNLYIT